MDEGNGKFNLIVLCWGEGHGSAIHDHANSHCFMKVLQGSLSEVRYAWPEGERTDCQQSVDSGDDNINDHRVLKETSRTQVNLNEVAYINGKYKDEILEQAHATDVKHTKVPNFGNAACRLVLALISPHMVIKFIVNSIIYIPLIESQDG